VYVSFNAGDRWERLSLNLPDVQVPDLQITERDLVIATHGRSMWILRDLEPIRQHADSVARAAAHLYQPRDGIRNAYQPVFQYTLGAEADSLLMEVLDGNGRVIRTFANSARQDATRDSLKQARAVRDSLIKLGRAEPDTCAVPDYVPPAPGRKTGINRFEWDGRYPGATVFSCMVIWSGAPEQGPVAPPGTYQVRLTANGVSQTRRFSWARDPRWTATDQDLVAQFELGLKIRDQVSAANEAVIGIRAIRAGITNALAAKPDRRLRQSADRLLPVLKTVEEALYQVRNRSGQDPLNFPIKLNNRLAALGSSVATGDARPTDASYVVFKELSDELAGHLRKLNTALTAELPQVNERLTALRLEPLSIGRFDRPFLKIP
jgi:hypothetical protein